MAYAIFWGGMEVRGGWLGAQYVYDVYNMFNIKT